MTKLKKFNIFVMLSCFSKALVELFIPLMLYESGYSIKWILLFFLIKFSLILVFIPLSVVLGKKINFKNLIILSNFLFIGMNVFLNYFKLTKLNLFLFCAIYAMYLIFYWIGRHVYGMHIIEEKKTTESVSSYTIFTLLGSLPATYLGAVILKKANFSTLLIVIFIVSILSVIPLFFIKQHPEKEKLEFKNLIKKFPVRNYLFLFFEQFKFVGLSLFPLYIYLNVSKEFEYIGISNALINISSIIYIYFLSKFMDKNKKDYLSLMCILMAIVWIFKLNIFNPNIILFIVFIEGVFRFGLENIVLRDIYSFGKEYKVVSYNVFIEFLRNFFRVIFILLVILFKFNLKFILYLGVASLFISAFVKFEDGKFGYKNIKTKDPTIKQ